MYLS
jgi:8-oxo-dGTP diphosphatase